MAEFRPAVPQLADFGSAFQKGMASGMSAVQDKRNYALKLRTAAMQEERFGWEKKQQMTAEYLKKVNKSFVDESIWGDPMAEVKGISSMWADGKADSVMSMVSNRLFSNANKQNYLDIYNSVNAGNPEASQAMFDVEFRKRQEQENLKIFTVMQNGLKFHDYLNPDGSDRRDKQIYSQLVVDNPAFQTFANEAGNTTIMQQFDWGANQSTVDAIEEWAGDKFRKGTLLGDTKSLIQENPMLAPLAAIPLALPIAGGVAAYKKWGPSSKGGVLPADKTLAGDLSKGSKPKVSQHQKFVTDLTNKVNEAEAKFKNVKDGLKVDGKKYAKTPAGKAAQKAALTKAEEILAKAKKGITTYNDRVGIKKKIAQKRSLKGSLKWFAPTIGGAVGGVFGEKGEAVGTGAGGAYLMKDAAIKGGSGLTKFVLKKLGARIPAALAASAMDGPLPFGEILSLGIGAYTIWSAIKEYNALK